MPQNTLDQEIKNRLAKVTPGQRKLFNSQLASGQENIRQSALNRLGMGQGSSFNVGAVVDPFRNEESLQQSMQSFQKAFGSGNLANVELVQQGARNLGLQFDPNIPNSGIPEGGEFSNTFDPVLQSPMMRKYDAEMFSPDLQEDAFQQILANARAAGINVNDEATLQNLKLQFSLDSLDEEEMTNASGSSRQSKQAFFDRQFEQGVIQRSRLRALEKQDIDEDEARSVAEYMFKRIEDLSNDNIIDMKKAKDQETARTRRMLGRGIDDAMGVKVIADVASSYDDKISKIRRDRDAELTRIATSQANLERGFSLAKSSIEDSTLEQIGRIQMNYMAKINEIETMFEGNSLKIRQAKRQAVLDRVDNTFNAFREKEREERELAMWNLDYQQKRQNLAATQYQEINGELFDTQTGEFVPREQFDADMLVADYKNLSPVNLFGHNGIITGLGGGPGSGQSAHVEGLDVDFGKLNQAPVPSLIDGVVLAVQGGGRSLDPKSNRGWGNNVLIQDRKTGEVLRVSHLASIDPRLKPGVVVPQGSIVGIMGNTGNSQPRPGGDGGHVDYTMYADRSLKKMYTAKQVLAVGVGRVPTTQTNKHAQAAMDIMDPFSNVTIGDYSQEDRVKIIPYLNQFKNEAAKSGDFTGILKASAGGTEVTDSFTDSMTKALTVVSQIESINDLLKNNKIKDITTGSLIDISPLTGFLKSKYPWNTPAQELNALLTGTVPNLARGIYGERGVLTEADVDLYKQTLPNLRQTSDVRKAVMAATLRTIKKGIENQLNAQASAGKDVSGYAREGGIYQNVIDKINTIDRELVDTAQKNNPKFKPTASVGIPSYTPKVNSVNSSKPPINPSSFFPKIKTYENYFNQ